VVHGGLSGIDGLIDNKASNVKSSRRFAGDSLWRLPENNSHAKWLIDKEILGAVSLFSGAKENKPLNGLKPGSNARPLLHGSTSWLERTTRSVSR
jgi:hypothetical protein